MKDQKITRLIVFGYYANSVDKIRYIVERQDLTPLLIIEEGKPFCTARMNRPFIPRRVKNKKEGSKDLLLCEQFDDNNQVIKETAFLLLPNKLGWWALTPQAAKNGVFHHFKPASNILEKRLNEWQLSKRIVQKVDGILHFTNYGRTSNTRNSTFCTNGNVEITGKGEFESDRVCIKGGTYVIIYKIEDGKPHRFIERILITKEADLEEVVEALESIYK